MEGLPESGLTAAHILPDRRKDCPDVSGSKCQVAGQRGCRIGRSIREAIRLHNYAYCVQFPLKALFVELPAFERHRQNCLDDEAFRKLQMMLLRDPVAGDVIAGTGGLRKVRFADSLRGKGKRGGLRVIYYWRLVGNQFWLFTLYGKDEMDDLSAREARILKTLLERELDARKMK
jgi:hypothetical protein